MSRSPPLGAGLAACAVAACSQPPAPAPQAPTVPVVSIASASGAPAGAAPPPAPPPARRLVVERRKLATDLDAMGVKAPCDLARAYRGTIGKTKVSVVVHPDAPGAASLVGLSHYDHEGDGLALTGKRSGPARFTLSERGGGTFAGACDAATGALEGTFQVGTKKEPFALRPLPDGWPGLYWVDRKKSFLINDPHPYCATLGPRKDPFDDFAPDGVHVICPPTDPARLRELAKDTDWGHCWVEDQSFRVFGGPSLAAERKTNGILRDASSFDESVKELSKCRPPRSVSDAQRLVDLGSGILVVQDERSDDYGGTHPMSYVHPGAAIDLETGEQVARADVIADVAKLRGLAAACLPLYAAAHADPPAEALPHGKVFGCDEDGPMPTYLWGCAQHHDEPFWTLTTQGIVIGAQDNAHAMQMLDGTGPIIPWAVLARDGALPGTSRMSRLFAGVAPAAKGAPACTSAYEGDAWLTWREAP
jgi:hypothetical protein